MDCALAELQRPSNSETSFDAAKNQAACQQLPRSEEQGMRRL